MANKLTKIQINDILENIKDKLIKKNDLINLVYDVIQDKNESIKIFNNLRKINKIQFVFASYYYILSEKEKLKNNINYSTFDLVACVLNKLKISWYFGLDTANNLNKITWQSNRTIYIINNKYSKNIKINNEKIVFMKMKKELICDFQKNISPNRIQLNISTNEKTYQDFKYFKKISPIELKEKLKIK